MFKIGNISIPGDVILAPMAGITDSPYRRICRRMGSAYSFTEFVSTDGLTRGNIKSLRMLRYHEEERPLVFQIFGNNPDVIVDAAKLIEELGPDAIDLNMGCSVRKVALKGSGAGLLLDPPRAGRIIEGMVKNLRIPVTAKIRLGWNQSSRNYRDVARILESSGVSLLSVHGRTRDQAYGGRSDWDAIGEIKSVVSIPVLGNGDIESHADARAKIRTYGVDGVLIGRAAIGNPWIFQHRDTEPSLEEVVGMMLSHLQSMTEFYGEEHGLRLFRKHAVKYVRGVPGASETRKALVTSTSTVSFREICQRMLDREGVFVA